jgi:hypothetical protein
MASVTGGIDIGENSPWRIDCSSIADCEKRSLAGCAGSGYTPATRDWILNAFVGLCIGRAWRNAAKPQHQRELREKVGMQCRGYGALGTHKLARIASNGLHVTGNTEPGCRKRPCAEASALATLSRSLFR